MVWETASSCWLRIERAALNAGDRHSAGLTCRANFHCRSRSKLKRLLCICADTGKHLSTAEIVGACIGAVLCAALAVALGGLLLWRWRFRRQHHSSMGSASNELVGLSWSHAYLMCQRAGRKCRDS